MENDFLALEKRLMNRNKWTYSLGGIGRDMMYSLVASFFIIFIQFTKGLTAQQFSVVGIILVIGRIWDGINDPIMGGIVDNTRSKWGKFKPWIVLGAILTGISVILMFNLPVTGWGFVIFFGIIYFFWEIAWTLNDIPYWSLLPNLATDKKNRDQIAMMVVVFAAVGAFLANAIVTFTTVGNAIKGYSIISITFVIFFLACTALTVFGVKEPRMIQPEKEEKVSLKQMFGSIKNNDQLLWSALSLLLYSVGSGLLVALGYNFFYLELGYDGSMVLVFIVTFGVTTIVIQSFYAQIAKRFKRNTLLKFSIAIIVFGYLMMLALDYIPFLSVSLFTVSLFGGLVFGGQAIFYMVTIVNMTNTIEYNEYRTGQRNEAVLFSLRPFVTKLASAIQQGVVTLVLVVSGIYALSQNVSQLELQKNNFDTLISVELQQEYKDNVVNRTIILDNEDMTEEEKNAVYDALLLVEYQGVDGTLQEMYINDAANAAFRDSANGSMHIILRLAITILPIILIYFAYLIFMKKFVITEEYYEDLLIKITEKESNINKANN
ncbi:MAG TPA: glycoside-pentoside-hexuronide (GPH):cation symporter [Bacillota bacterium]|nr:glycoside-pentoside-hexuronide (GPH):cation symporter [Bacillota bacterium]